METNAHHRHACLRGHRSLAGTVHLLGAHGGLHRSGGHHLGLLRLMETDAHHRHAGLRGHRSLADTVHLLNAHGGLHRNGVHHLRLLGLMETNAHHRHAGLRGHRSLAGTVHLLGAHGVLHWNGGIKSDLLNLLFRYRAESGRRGGLVGATTVGRALGEGRCGQGHGKCHENGWIHLVIFV